LGDRAERSETTVLADRAQLVSPARQDLVGIGLVADIPQNLVLRAVKQGVQGNGQLACAEVRAEVSADLADRVDDVLPHLLGEPRELLVREQLQVMWATAPREQLGPICTGHGRSLWGVHALTLAVSCLARWLPPPHDVRV